MWRWPLTPTSGIRWFWELIGQRFKILLGVLCADASCGKEKPGREAAVRTGEAEPGPAEAAPGERNAVERLVLTERDDFPLEQSQDASLRNAFDQVRSIDGQPLQSARPPSYPYFSILKDRLYWVTQDAQSKQDTTQLLVPKSRREMLFQAAHCNPMAGHLGQAATLNRLMTRFFWPGIHENVRRWCAACRECQLVNPPASPKAPLRPLPLMQVPFERIGMDLIGPLEWSARGHRFALVLVNYATRYPEAVALRNISAKSVAEALFSMISRVGIPKEILTDQGTAFMSRTIRELYELLGINSVRTSVYHPQTDGLVERFNRTLKTMIRKFVHEDAKNWDKWLEPLLFAVREVPQASTGFSPFELLYGRQPRGVSWGRLGRRDLRRAKTKFSMCWTWEQSSTPWGSSPWRICYRPRTSKAGYTIGGPDYASLHREIKYLYCSPLLALNYSPSGKDLSRSHGG